MTKEETAIFRAIEDLKSELATSLFIGYGRYYNKDFMIKTSYTQDDREVTEFTEQVRNQYHTRLAGLKICLLKAYKFGKDDEPLHAVKLHGQPALAVARNYDLKRRLQTGYDCEITFDGVNWDNASDSARSALVDHELTHFMPLVDAATGQPKLDDLGRPKVKLIPDEIFITGFISVVERHGEHAGEAKSIKAAHAAVLAAIARSAQAVALNLDSAA